MKAEKVSLTYDQVKALRRALWFLLEAARKSDAHDDELPAFAELFVSLKATQQRLTCRRCQKRGIQTHLLCSICYQATWLNTLGNEES